MLHFVGTMITRREMLKRMLGAAAIAVAPPFLTFGTANEPGKEAVALECFDYEGVSLLDGKLRRQYLATRDFYFEIPDDDILKGFRERAGLQAPGNSLGGWYGGEPRLKKLLGINWADGDYANAFGQWLSAMARMYRATGDTAMRDKAVHLMHEWAKTIEPDGYFYYSRSPFTYHYTYDKTVCGLVDLYHYGGERSALPLLERVTEWARRNLDRSRRPANPENPDVNSSEWYTLSENLYRAYQFTGDRSYKDFGDIWRYPDYWFWYSGQGSVKPDFLHAYSHVNTLSSAAMTYAVSGDARYLQSIERAYEYLQSTQTFATGGFGPAERLQPADGSLGKSLEQESNSFETPCGCWAGLKLARYLLSFTGDARYGDWIEKLVYNGIGAALPMAGRGRTFYYSDYRLGGGRKQYYPAAWPCCSGTYPQAVAEYHNLIYFRGSGGLYVNLFVPSSVSFPIGGQEVRVVQETQFPESDTTALTVHAARPVEFALSLRSPRWAGKISASVNKQAEPITANPTGWSMVRRRWNSGDRLEVRLPMAVRAAAIDPQHPRRVALSYGPVVLVRQHSTKLEGEGPLAARLQRPGKQLEFVPRVAQYGIFVPYYEVAEGEPYDMYFEVDGFPPGEPRD